MSVGITIDKEEFKIEEDKISVEDIIRLAKRKIDDYEVQKRDCKTNSLEKTYDDPKDIIDLKDGDCFTVRYAGVVNTA